MSSSRPIDKRAALLGSALGWSVLVFPMAQLARLPDDGSLHTWIVTAVAATFAMAIAIVGFLPWLPSGNRRARGVVVHTLGALRFGWLAWRAAATMPPFSWSFVPLFAYVLLFLEIVVTVAAQRTFASFQHLHDRRAEADRGEGWFGDRAPHVAILVPTFNETQSILEKTVLGAMRQEYPNFSVWVLDDGQRAWVRRLAEDLGAHALVRSDRAHAKAGNLNHALAHLAALPDAAPFVAVLDADVIPRPTFLKRCVSLLCDERVALVQTPPVSLNPDLFQRSVGTTEGWPEVTHFHQAVIQPALDAADSGMCCGTSFVARVAALEDVGGFATESVVEDVLTGDKLSLRGWRSVYLEEYLTVGMAPEGLAEYLTQRARWSLGVAQVARWLLRERASGRSLLTRLSIFEGRLRWGLSAFGQIVFLIAPLLAWAFHLVPFRVSAAEVLFFGVPMMILSRAFAAWSSGGTWLPLVKDAAAVLDATTVVHGTFWGLFAARPQPFAVTDKGVQRDCVVVHARALRWLAGYAFLSFATLAYAVWRDGVASLTRGEGAVWLAWSAWNLLTVAVCALPCLEGPRRRAEERYACGRPTVVHVEETRAAGRVVDVSTGGCLLALDAPAISVGSRLEVELHGIGAMRGDVVRSAGEGLWGVRFAATTEQRRAAIARIFLTTDYVRPPSAGSVTRSARALARAFFRTDAPPVRPLPVSRPCDLV